MSDSAAWHWLVTGHASAAIRTKIRIAMMFTPRGW